MAVYKRYGSQILDPDDVIVARSGANCSTELRPPRAAQRKVRVPLNVMVESWGNSVGAHQPAN